MVTRASVIVGILLAAVSLAFTGWAWFRIPDSALIATHWGLHDQVNGRMHKLPGLLIAPGLMLLVTVFFLAIRRIEPRRNNLTRSGGLYIAGWVGAVAIIAMVQGIVIATALGYRVPVSALVTPSVAVLMIAIGNVLPQTRSNFFVGVRTPWTLESEYSWEKTNRWAGRFFVLSGLVAFVAMAMFGPIVAGIVLMVSIIASALIAMILSYVFWTRDPERHGHDSVPE